MVRTVYMEIEYPECGPIAKYMGQTYPTIGSFYNAVRDAFQRLPDSAIKKERQREYPGLGGTGLFRIDSIKDAVCAIKTIKEQGEGTSQSPSPSEDPDDRAHYYRFAELYHGHQLIKKDGRWVYAGDPIALPAAYPMAEVPAGGYDPKVTEKFNTRYTDVVNLLQASWEREDGQRCLKKAVDLMPSLGGLARRLMKLSLPDGSGCMGPDFRTIPHHETPC